jgi:hypothetical protein
MKKVRLMQAVVLLGCVAFWSFIVPSAWKPSGPAENKYEIGLWKVGGYESQNCGVIRANKKVYDPGEYGSLIQLVSSQRFLGKRIKMTGYMKTRGVEGIACFYIRSDKEGGKEPLTIDNMKGRQLRGNNNWGKHTVEIDVPLNASKLAFGAILDGPGVVWFDSLSIDIVGQSTIAADYVMCDTSLPREPLNLNFEQ